MKAKIAGDERLLYTLRSRKLQAFYGSKSKDVLIVELPSRGDVYEMPPEISDLNPKVMIEVAEEVLPDGIVLVSDVWGNPWAAYFRSKDSDLDRFQVQAKFNFDHSCVTVKTKSTGEFLLQKHAWDWANADVVVMSHENLLEGFWPCNLAKQNLVFRSLIVKSLEKARCSNCQHPHFFR